MLGDFRKAAIVKMVLGGASLAFTTPIVAQEIDPFCSPLSDPKMPAMKLKFYNDTNTSPPGQWVFPVITMGKGPIDTWMQFYFSVTQNQMEDPSGAYNFPRDKAYRLYVNPTKGIAPGQKVCITLPLYTKIKDSGSASFDGINPKDPGQFIDWWQGGTIQLFYSSNVNAPRALWDDRNYYPVSNPIAALRLLNSLSFPLRSLGNDYKPFSQNPDFAGNRDAWPRPNQFETSITAANTVKPVCKGTNPCESLVIQEDTADLPKADPSQLLEYTLGARQAVDQPKGKDSPPAVLDLKNVDFDISYVNVAYGPAAMGPVNNDQVGYVGTPQSYGTFLTALNNFRSNGQYPGWPRFVREYKPSTKSGAIERVTVEKFASPLEVMPSLTAPNPRTDLESVTKWNTDIWAPIGRLREAWQYHTSPGNGYCLSATNTGTKFCQAINDIIPMMQENYKKYLSLFANGTCQGTAVKMKHANGGEDYNFDATTDFVMSHVYGWTPFTEAVEADPTKGCKPTDNLLADSSAYYQNEVDCPTQDQPNRKCKLYGPYLAAKKEFDELNYGQRNDSPYNRDKPASNYSFNPWVVLVHGDPTAKNGMRKFLKIPGVYAYSVDDAVGNVQAWGEGVVIDVGSTKHLENQNPATPPITITVGKFANADGMDRPRFTDYLLCPRSLRQNGMPAADDPHWRPINQLYTSFILNSNNPSCQVWLRDNGDKVNYPKTTNPLKKSPQYYTFTLRKESPTIDIPPFLPEFSADKSPGWDNTGAYIDCKGNLTSNDPASDYGKFPSKYWCCSGPTQPIKTLGRGVFAYSKKDPLSIHSSLDHFVNAMPPLYMPIPPASNPGTEGNFNPDDPTCDIKPDNSANN
ncbi:MAG: hypothetical protein EKK29_21980 [Hyphomicrobiales bacterium]|nr:MAG: hypothetical protein EKK29_21980 [Hyphomicrobiales bacterium]